MRFLSRAATALLIGAAAPAALVAPAVAQTCACPPTEGVAAVSGPAIQAAEAPPPLPEYEQPAMPAPGYHWTPGYWAWNNVDYYWVPGAWVEPPRVGVLWTPPYWGFVGGVFLFHAGYWAPHVGFYGGVNYGFGYGGAGYEGGRWENGQFFYNRAVNNFGATPVTRVYNQPITVNNTTINRVSYNGGPGGLQVRPTPAQEQVMAEQHIKATPAQVSQVRSASVDAQQFKSENKGKPAVAATPRPGELKGPGVVPAKAAGAAEITPANAPLKNEEKAKPGEKLPGGKQPLNAAPNAEEKTLPGMKPNGAAAPANGEKPVKPGPLNAPKAEEKLPAGTAPKGASKLPEAEKPPRKELEPNGAEKPMKPEPLNAPKAEEKLPAGTAPKGASKLPEAEKPPRKELEPKGAEKPQGAEKSQEMEKPRAQQGPKKAGEPKKTGKPEKPEKPQGLLTPPGGAKPMDRAMSAGPARPERAVAAERKPPRPGGKEPECGKPGRPACPR